MNSVQTIPVTVLNRSVEYQLVRLRVKTGGHVLYLQSVRCNQFVHIVDCKNVVQMGC